MLSSNKKSAIIEMIYSVVSKKLIAYKPESHHMPFHHRLLGKNRMALFSFVQSLNTTLGTSIFESVAKILAEGIFDSVKTQYSLPKEISKGAQDAITDIINKLSNGKKMTRKEIDKIILPQALSDEINILKPNKVDIFLKNKNQVYLIDIKTVKPNIGEFKNYKKQILEWAVIYKKYNNDSNVHSLIAMPYNPYHPKPYERLTIKDIFDTDEEIKIAEEFWNFLAGGDCYDELLDCFAKAGNRLQPEIDKKFTSLK
ncbi:MAG: TdeIII family type II restriction endonuclease [Alphaproteobacteria bacterium]